MGEVKGIYLARSASAALRQFQKFQVAICACRIQNLKQPFGAQLIRPIMAVAIVIS